MSLSTAGPVMDTSLAPQLVVGSWMFALGWPTPKMKPSILPSHSAGPCSSAFSSAASEKSLIFQPIAAISSSIAARVPEPGLPTLKRLPFRSLSVRALTSLRATTVNGSGCTENTARRSPCGPPSLNCARPLAALNCTSDCVKPRSSSPALRVLTLNTEPPVDSTEQRMPCLARSLLTRRQIAPPAA